MNYFFITGTSSGIGEELAKQLLQDSTNKVIGISRRKSISHENYSHISADFMNLNEIEQVEFPHFIDAKQIVLVNNSGMLGEITRIGKRVNSNIADEISVNMTAPLVLMNNFAKAYQTLEIERSILNVSSGAARSPIDAWGTYCATKAGLDMYSLVFEREQKILDDNKRINIFSVAPGVVETHMQEVIREVNPNEFSGLQKFIDLKNNNELYSVEKAAKNLIYILQNSSKFSNPIIDVRDF